MVPHQGWRPYWYRLSVRTEDGYSFLPLDARGPLTRIPAASLTAGLDAWAARLLESADDELDDLRGDIRIEVFGSAAPDDSGPIATYCGVLHDRTLG